jgi:CHAD domain-containing protein
MYDKKLLGYYKNKLTNVNRNFILALEQNDSEALHDLRVDLKYLKAFFRLVESINHDFNAKKGFKSFRSIARNTGSLRDVQVQTKLNTAIADELDIDIRNYLRYFEEQEIKERNIFHRFSQDNPLEKLKKNTKKIKKALDVIPPVRAETRVQGRFYNLRNNLVFLHAEDALQDEILHEVRKLSKETHYTLEIIQECFGLFGDGKDFIRKIKKLHKALGNWHDFDVSLSYIDSFKDHTQIQFSEEPYNHLLKHVRAKKQTARKAVLSAFGIFSETAVHYEHQK